MLIDLRSCRTLEIQLKDQKCLFFITVSGISVRPARVQEHRNHESTVWMHKDRCFVVHLMLTYFFVFIGLWAPCQLLHVILVVVVKERRMLYAVRFTIRTEMMGCETFRCATCSAESSTWGM